MPHHTRPHGAQFEPVPAPQPAAHSGRYCPGRCNDRWRTAEQARLTEHIPHALVPIDGNPTWCTACRNRLFYRISGLPYLAVLVQLEVENATSAENERVSGSNTTPLHDREAWTLLLDAIWSTLTEYEDQVRHERRMSPRVTTKRRGAQLQAAALFLPRHIDWFLQERPDDDEGPDPDTGRHTPTSARGLSDRIEALEHRIRRVTRTDERRPERRPAIPCPECDLMALEYDLDTNQRATGLTNCRACNRQHTPEHMDRWLSQLAAHARKWPGELQDFYAPQRPTESRSA